MDITFHVALQKKIEITSTQSIVDVAILCREVSASFFDFTKILRVVK